MTYKKKCNAQQIDNLIDHKYLNLIDLNKIQGEGLQIHLNYHVRKILLNKNKRNLKLTSQNVLNNEIDLNKNKQNTSKR